MTTIRYSAPFGKLIGLAALTALAAGAVNVGLFHVAKALGGFGPDLATQQGDHIAEVHILMAGLLTALVGAGVYALLVRYTQRPVFIFSILAVIVLILDGYTPFTLINVTVIDNVFLQIMHLICGGAYWYVFTQKATQRS